MIGIGDNYGCAAANGIRDSIAKPYLIIPAENILIIFDESVHVMTNCIGRIYKEKIAILSFIHSLFKVSAADFSRC